MNINDRILIPAVIRDIKPNGALDIDIKRRVGATVGLYMQPDEVITDNRPLPFVEIFKTVADSGVHLRLMKAGAKHQVESNSGDEWGITEINSPYYIACMLAYAESELADK